MDNTPLLVFCWRSEVKGDFEDGGGGGNNMAGWRCVKMCQQRAITDHQTGAAGAMYNLRSCDMCPNGMLCQKIK